MSLKDKIKNLVSKQPPSTTDMGEILDGGNSYIVKRELQARINNMSLFNQVDAGNTNLDNVVYDEYFLMLFQKNYFVNMYDIETEDKEFKKVWNLFVELCFWFGEAAIVNNGIKGLEDTKSLIPVYIKNKQYTPLGDIDKNFEYYYGAPILPMMGDSKFNFKNNTQWGLKSFKNNDDEFVYGKWNTQCFGAWVWMSKFVKYQKELMYLTHSSAYLQKEILFLKVNNKSAVDSEVKQIYNPKSNVIFELGVDWEGDGKMENRWSVDTPSSDKTMTINEVYDWHIQKYYELFGRRNNVDFKKERNITSEVDASQEQFDIITNETRKYLEIALKECKEKFGVEGEFKYDGKDKDNAEGFENKNDGDNGEGFQNNQNKNR